MKTLARICLMPFLFSLFLLTPALAFTDYAMNEGFTSDTYGVKLFSENPMNLSWNATHLGQSGILFIENTANVSNDNVLSFTNEFNLDQTDPYVNYTETFLSCPTGKICIVSVQLALNDTFYSTAPVLVVRTDTQTKTASASNGLNNTWQNLTIAFNASEYVEVTLEWATDPSYAQRLALNWFKFYTLDIIEPSVTWTTDTLERYCGINPGVLCMANLGAPMNNTNKGWFVGLTEDKVPCMAVNTGNITIAGFASVNDSIGTNYAGCNNNTTTFNGYYNCRNQIWKIENHGWLAKPDISGSYLGFDFFMESLNINTMKATFLSDPVDGSWSAGRTYVYGWTNGNGQIFWGYTWTNQSNVPILSINQSRQTLTLNETPASPGGTQWRYFTSYSGGGVNSSFYNFFSYANPLDNSGYICNNYDNYERYYDTTTGAEINNTYCGACGCENAGVWGYGCAIPNANQTGTHCTGSAGQRGYETNTSECPTNSTTGLCPVNSVCISYTSTDPSLWGTSPYVSHEILPGLNTIACLNLTDSEIIETSCINSTGSNINCSLIAVVPATPAICIDKDGAQVFCSSFSFFEKVAIYIGGMFGESVGTDLTASEAVTSLLISLLLGFAGLMIVVFAGQTEGALTIFGIAFLAGLVMFTYGTWFPVWLFVLLLVIDGLLISGIIREIIGGD